MVAGLAVVASRTTLPVAKQPCPRGAGCAVMAAGLPTWRPSMRWQEGPASAALGSRSPLTGPGPPAPHGPHTLLPFDVATLPHGSYPTPANTIYPHPSLCFLLEGVKQLPSRRKLLSFCPLHQISFLPASFARFPCPILRQTCWGEMPFLLPATRLLPGH